VREKGAARIAFSQKECFVLRQAADLHDREHWLRYLAAMQLSPGQGSRGATRPLASFYMRITCAMALLFTIASSGRLYATDAMRFYADDSFWNTPVAAHASADPNSSAEISASILPWASRFGFSNGAFGVPLAYASANDKVYTIACTGTVDQCNGKSSFKFPIPSGSKAATGSDHHLSVLYTSRAGSPYAGKELDIWEAHYDPASDTWSGIGMNFLDLYGSGVCQPTAAQLASGQSCGSSVAAGVAALGGLVRPEEIQQGHIDHVLAMATPANLTGYVACPATRTDGNHAPPAIPEGALMQLDPTFNVAAQNWPTWVKIIAVALQKYGAINVDYADVPLVRGVTDQNAGVPSWASVGVPVDQYNNLAMIPWKRLRVIATQRCH
jgi:hypothetical protein